MKIQETGIDGLLIVEPRRHADDRGFFSESWNKSSLEEAGIDYDFIQDNHSLTHDEDAIRGLHYQAPPYEQAKLVRCGRGTLFDVVVDVRRGSPNYGEWFGIELSAENGRQLMVPAGFLHGFATREPMTEIIYKVTNHYNGAADGAVLWNSCGINWGVETPSAISDKDANAVSFADFDSPFEWVAS